MSEDNGSFLAGMADSGNPAGNAPVAPAGAVNEAPAPTGAPQAATPPANGAAPAAKAERPEWVKDKFWDPDKGEIRTQDLANSYNQMEKYLGGEKIPVPKDPDDKLAWEMYWKAGGVPDAPDAYQFSRPDLPANLPYDEDREKAYRNLALEAHLNPTQANAIYDRFVKQEIERHLAWEADRKQQREKLEADFNREHGRAADGVKQGIGALMGKYADPDFKQYLDETGLGNDPRMLRVMARINKDMGGVGKLHGAPSAAGAPRSPDELAAKIADFRNLHSKVLMNQEDPTHKLRTEQLFALHEELAAARKPSVL